jgi:hypothetical protein
MSLENLIICKPKKSENNTYICLIWEDVKKPFEIELKNSIIVYEKSNVLYIKNKDYKNFFYDLNLKIIDIVKKNCSEWFHNNMNIDLIDDYYTNTLVYDKQYGDLIKIKLVNAQEIKTNIKCDLSIRLCNLRFYKQKFLLEIEITDIKPVELELVDNDSTDGFFSEDELPSPNNEEIETIKIEHSTKANDKLRQIRDQLSELDTKSKMIEGLLNELNESITLDNIVKVCDCLEKIYE